MFNKKPKTEEQFTPSDLTKLTEKEDKQIHKGESIFKRFSARRSSKELTKTQRWKRRGFWALIALLIILLIMFIISMIISQYGDLVISIERSARGKGITVSETEDLKDGVTILSAEKVKEVTNITYDWLPLDELDTKNGSYNGKNYLAYTFYLQNNGTEKVDYIGQLEIKGVSKSMDEAVRVMVYKNGEPAIYGKHQYKKEEPETDATAFESDKTVMSTTTKDFQPGDMDKYTIVSWVEGNDPECINDIMGGFIRMNMLFSIADEEE
ncbi:MAG: hypothetical protein ACI4W1_02895 [Ruminococcus sp.]